MPKKRSAELTLRQQALLLLITTRNGLRRRYIHLGVRYNAAMNVLKVLGIFEVSDGKLQEFIEEAFQLCGRHSKVSPVNPSRSFDGESTKTEARE